MPSPRGDFGVGKSSRPTAWGDSRALDCQRDRIEVSMNLFVRRAPLITLSGLDGAGKSLQTSKLLELFQHRGYEPAYLWSRGGYTPGMESFKALIRKLPWKALPPPGNNPQRDREFSKRSVRRAWLS